MKNLRKKGFTIVELVIVIAVIAVLAAVLIPTFSNVIKKADMSVDQQVVRQMNTILATEAIDKNIESLRDVHAVLVVNGYSTENYVPKTKDTRFVWIKNINTIAHVDKNNNVLYPANLSDLQYDENNWFDLNSLVDTDPNRLYLDDAPSSIVINYEENEDVLFADNPEIPTYNQTIDGVEYSAKPLVYSFFPEDDLSSENVSEEILQQREKYKEWIADFAIIANDDFAANSMGIVGRYRVRSPLVYEFPWIEFILPTDCEKGTKLLLMKDILSDTGLQITYELLLEVCKTMDGTRDSFNCGAFNFLPENYGKSITVQLRLYSPEEYEKPDGKYFVCDEMIYTFTDPSL